uniref:Retrovirus-related Pol polyprotein from transposon TNT 1-94 n=1 Tax=Cannabis sativa TaxID=3483 RepID=A0A803PQN8_CANSA
MGNAKFEIEKFGGKNDFSLWMVKMRALLVQQGIQDAILGDDKIKDKTDAKRSEILEKAHSALILSLGDKDLREVSKETTTAGLWKKLESLYMTKSLVNRLFLKKKLNSFKMQPGKSVEDRMDDFNKIILDLENCDIKIESEDQAIIVLNSLPLGRYEHFFDTMMFTRDSLTLEEVHNALMSKELKKSAGGSEKYGNVDLVSSEYTSDDGYESAGVMVASIGYSDLDWVINSGCSFHVCPNRTQFSEYKEIAGRTVKLGDNRSCIIKGIGSVKLKLTGGLIRELHQDEDPSILQYQLIRDRTRRAHKAPKRFGFADIIHYAITVYEFCENEPRTYKEAMESKERIKWNGAMKDEIRSLIKNKTWILIIRPSDRKIIGYKWVYKYKEEIPRVEEARYKARLVAKGFTHKEGVDFS